MIFIPAPRPALHVVIAAVCSLVGAAECTAATLTWTNTLGGAWNVAANWSPNAVPGAADTANITTPGNYTVTVSANTTVAALSLGAASGLQTLALSANTLSSPAGTVGANGILEVSGGGLTGKLTVQNGGVLNFASTSTKTIYSLTLLNQGTVNHLAGQLNHGATPATVITNAGLWDIQGDLNLVQGIGGPQSLFVNTGTLRKSAGAGLAQLNSLDMDLGGTIQVLSGTLRIGGAGQRALGAVTTVSANAALELNSGNFHDAGGSFGGAGSSQFTGGTLTLNTNILAGLRHTGGTINLGPAFQQAGAITDLTLDGSTLSGADQRVGTGTLTVNSGGLTGKLTVQNGGVLNFASTSTKTIYSLTLLNQGTVNHLAGQLNHGATPATVITNAGLWDIQGDLNLVQGIGGPQSLFVNTGTLRKSAGAGLAQLNSLDMDLGGTIQVLSGTLRIGGAGQRALGAVTTVSANAALELNSGNFHDAGGSFGGAGSSQFTGGTLTLNTNILAGLRHTGGTINLGPAFQQAGAITDLTLDGSTLSGADQRVGTGTLTVNSGGLTGKLTVQNGGVLNFASTSAKTIYSLTLLNQGTVNHLAGQLNHGATPATVITNAGLWDIQGDLNLVQGIGGPQSLFVNSGTLRKSADAGLAQLNSLDMDLGGTIQVLSGTLRIGGAGQRALGAVTTVSANAALELNSGNFHDAGGSFGGAGSSQFTGGTLTLNTNILAGLRHTGGTINLGPAFQQAGAITDLTLDGSTLSGADQRVGTGTLTVNSGGLTGKLTVQNGGVLNFASTSTKTIYSLTLLNQGTVNHLAGQLNHGATPATVITNAGLWDIQGDLNLVQGIGGPQSLFVNTGTLRKSAGAGLAQLNSLDMDLGGTIQVLSGTLRIGGAGQRALGAVTTVSANAALELNSGNFHDAGGSFGGAGSSQFTGGTLTLNTNILAGLRHTGGTINLGPAFQQAGAITDLTLDGSTLSGADQRVGTGTLTVNSGGLTGKLTVQNGGVLNFASTSAKTIYSLTLLNQGTVNHLAGQLNHGATPATVITNAGLWDIQGDLNLVQGIGGPQSLFVNSGTLRKSADAGLAQLNSLDMDLGGTIQVLSGTLRIGGAGQRALGAVTTVSANAALELNSGNFHDAGGSFGGAGSSQFTGGTLTLNTNILAGLRHTGGTINLGPAFQQAGAITDLTLDGSTLSGADQRVGTGTLTVNSGGLTGKLTVQNGGVLNFASTSTKTIYSLTLLNQGTVNHLAGQLNHGATPATVITNAGLWDIQGDLNLVQGIGGPQSLFVNSGTLRKSADAGLAQINSITLTNTTPAVIQCSTGTLRLPNSYVNTAGTLRLTGGRLESSGSLGFTGGTLDGTGSFGGGTFLSGTISPGVGGPGKITFTAGLRMSENVTVVLEAAGTVPETGYDQLAVTGAVGITNSILQFSAPSAIPIGAKLIVITNDSTDAIVGTFNGKPEDALFDVNLQLFRTRYAQGSGNDMAIVRDDGGVRLTGIRINPAGQFEFRGLGTNGVTYAIYASPSVPTNNWTFLGNSTADVSGNFLFTDPDAFQFPRRFYQSLEP